MPDLISTRRRVPLDRVDEYDALWAAVRRAAEDRGAHAWRFRAAGREDTFMEFIEADDATAPGPAVQAAMDALDRSMGGGRTEHWEEAP